MDSINVETLLIRLELSWGVHSEGRTSMPEVLRLQYAALDISNLATKRWSVGAIFSDEGLWLPMPWPVLPKGIHETLIQQCVPDWVGFAMHDVCQILMHWDTLNGMVSLTPLVNLGSLLPVVRQFHCPLGQFLQRVWRVQVYIGCESTGRLFPTFLTYRILSYSLIQLWQQISVDNTSSAQSLSRNVYSCNIIILFYNSFSTFSR